MPELASTQMQAAMSTLPTTALENKLLHLLPTIRNQSGMITPLDPHNLTGEADDAPNSHPRRLTRRLLEILSKQFPVAADGSSAPIRPTTEGFQDPLLSISEIAKRGWDIQDTSRPSPPGYPLQALQAVPLPEPDAHLLAQWSSTALQEVIQEQTQYFAHGLNMSKRDVADVLDPIHRGIITETRAGELLQA
jgi:hypothetical protein